jgi:copper oxidase (laccase) domain-containing protein
MNREQRRALKDKGADDPKHVEQQRRKLIQDGTPQDVTSTRAKSQRHGKVTADKWNQ